MKNLESLLTPDEAEFVRQVVVCPGRKLNGGEAFSKDGEQTPLWKRPVDLGLIECVGSYKWRPTEILDIGIKNAA